MKNKKYFLAISAIAMLAVSCSDDVVSNIPQKGEKALVTFSCDSEGSEQTRGNFADLSGQSAGFKWEMGDKVGIFTSGSNNLEEITVTEVSSSVNKAVLRGNITVGDHYLGVYPKSAIVAKGDADDKVKVTIPAEQIVPITSTENNQFVDPKAFIQVGYTSSNAFQMMTPCSFLKFKTGAKNNIEWVKVSAYDGDDNPYAIVGDYTVTKSTSSSIALSTELSTQNVVTCRYKGGCFPANCSFGIAIRPGSYAKIVLEASDGTHKTATSMYDSGLTTHPSTSLVFERAYYYPMGEL